MIFVLGEEKQEPIIPKQDVKTLQKTRDAKKQESNSQIHKAATQSASLCLGRHKCVVANQTTASPRGRERFLSTPPQPEHINAIINTAPVICHPPTHMYTQTHHMCSASDTHTHPNIKCHPKITWQFTVPHFCHPLSP